MVEAVKVVRKMPIDWSTSQTVVGVCANVERQVESPSFSGREIWLQLRPWYRGVDRVEDEECRYAEFDQVEDEECRYAE